MTVADPWADLIAQGRRRRYRRNEVLFREGDRGTSVFGVVAGRVKVSVATPTGREVVLAVKGAGGLLGEQSAVDGDTRSATATALEEVDVAVVSGDVFRAFLASTPAAAMSLLAELSARVRQSIGIRVERDAADVSTRVARRLVALADQFGEFNGPTLVIPLPLRQDDLAGWVGASREATNRALGRLREAGLIRTTRQRIVVLDTDGLRAAASA